jgi:broad specificity phosphatase PhoE
MSTPDTVVHLLRHGEVHNPSGVLYGRLPGYRLSERGEAMAQLVADTLAAEGRDVVEVTASPLERAQQTAAPVARLFGLPVETDERLIEAGNAFEGSRFGAVALRRPDNWWRLRNPWRPSWGEPYVEIAARMLAAVEAARDAARGHEAVLVSHQLPIWTLRLHLTGRRYVHDPRRRQCALASVTSVTYDGDRFRGVSYAEPIGDPDPHAVPGA